MSEKSQRIELSPAMAVLFGWTCGTLIGTCWVVMGRLSQIAELLKAAK